MRKVIRRMNKVVIGIEALLILFTMPIALMKIWVYFSL